MNSRVNDQPSLIRRLIKIIITNILATIFAVIMLAWFNRESSAQQIAANFAASFVYSNFIGTIVALCFPQLIARAGRLKIPFNWLLLLSTLMLVTVAGCLCAGVLLTLIGVYQLTEFWHKFFFCFKLALVITAVIGSTLYIYQSLRLQLEETELQLRTKELAEAQALKLATQARLASLESRIHPHFLFNTLNSISALIQEDPALAERLVERLAALLRFSLDANQNNLVPLEQEIKIVNDYLEIEKARFVDRLQYRIEVPAALNFSAVPPLSIQTLVENSVKYAVSARRSGGQILVKADRVDDRLIITVWDDGPGFTKENIIAGHGIDNLRARLSAIFGQQASLEIGNSQPGMAVTLTMIDKPTALVSKV